MFARILRASCVCVVCVTRAWEHSKAHLPLGCADDVGVGGS